MSTLAPGGGDLVAIVTPLFNDWHSLRQLITDLAAVAPQCHCDFAIFVVNDGSTEPGPLPLEENASLERVRFIEIIDLFVNVGHQRALAVGLCAAAQDSAAQQIVLMDADGEDRPSDVQRLREAALHNPDAIVVARRAKRSESWSFRLFYRAYRWCFVLFTGKEISFGNFSLFGRQQAERVSMTPELWNNLPAAILRSRLPIVKVPIDRGRRYHGMSKMNFVSLSLHGMSAYSVYTDTILIRLLVATFFFAFVGLLAVATALVLRLFTHLATPGWGTTIFFGVAIIVIQTIFTTLTSALVLFNNRSQKLILPALEFRQYIRARRRVWSAAGSGTQG